MATSFGSRVSQIASRSTFDASCVPSSIFKLKHEIIVVVNIVLFEITTTSYVAFVNVIDENILIVVLSIVVQKKYDIEAIEVENTKRN